ncbi:MAG: hypothetical protein IPO59_20790 [Betaproteobacteria bacterium]|nr:hypothetical protein [Betaproteobacteria bacterium]
MADDAWSVIGPFVSRLGLFLLGMSMMTDGLKLAAGPALPHPEPCHAPLPLRSDPGRW